MNLYPLLRRGLFSLEAETAHEVSLRLMSAMDKAGLWRGLLPLLGAGGANTGRPVEVFGLRFPAPVGLAAGLDKNARHVDALLRCGFGFIEVGTVTPRAQPGNAKPRMFRLQRDLAIINRMGFNNDGVAVLLDNLRRRRQTGIVGINIGKNKDTPLERALDDYLFCLRAVHADADYVTINISSPNTPGLRSLQHGAGLRRLLDGLVAARQRLVADHGKPLPLLVKIAPDLDAEEIDAITATILQSGIDGVIVNNTSNQRPDTLRQRALAAETGGLSGAPITRLSDRVLQQVVSRLEGRLPVIAVGGIMSADDAARKLALGASLVQLYSGFVYHGPALVAQCRERLGRE